jgi:hypothetical protein
VAIWAHKKITDSILGYEPVSDRIISVRLNAKPRNISLIQAYGPTTTAAEEDIKHFYEELSRTIKSIPKGDMLLLTGDFNAKVGARDTSALTSVVGPYGLGVMNEAGEQLQDFCMEHDLVLANTMFQHHPRRLCTWTSPDGKTKNQIDYIAVAQKWKSSVRNCKTYPGADCDTDHQLLVASMKIRLAKPEKQNRIPPLNLEELKGDKAVQYATEVSNKFSVLEALREEKSPEDLWKNTKEILLEVASEILGSTMATKKKTWISAETFSLIKEKRESKNQDISRYRVLKADVQRRLRKDKQKQLDDMCEELETAQQRGNARKLFQTVRSITSKFQPRLQCIQSKNGTNLTEAPQIAERWKEYCEDLYSDKDGKDLGCVYQEREPPPLRSEVARAIRQTASRKSTGPDEVPAELFKEGGESVLDRMHRICVAIWETGEWPEEWTYSTFIPLPKKGDMKQCGNYRTIALVSHASKVLLRIILERIRLKTETEIADEQAGFRQGRGTRDQITNLRILMQKAHEHQQPLYMCFIDFKKAFDWVSHDRLWLAMMDMGYPLHLINLLTKLYKNQLARVKVAGSLSDWFHIKRGVRQGCVLSPYLFNILAEMVMRETLEGFQGGIKIGGRRVTNLRYADDIILLANSEMELQDLVDRLDRVSQKYSLLINIDKTKVMASDGASCNINIQGIKLEQVNTFPYLGSLITEDAECSKDFRARLSKGQAVRASLKKLWKNHGIPIDTKVRLERALVWPVATYGCEAWTVKKDEEQRLAAFEMKGLRQFLRVSWTAKKTNEWVLEKAGTERDLLAAVRRRKLAYYGHVMRKTGESLEKEIMQGTMPGSRARGRPRMSWMDNVRTWTNLNTGELIRKVEDRVKWRQFARSAANPRIEEG